MKLRKISLILGLLFCAGVSAQQVGVKTNLAYDGMLAPNLGVELSLSRHLSADLSGGYLPYRDGFKRWKLWFVQPEIRYWTSRPFSGHFVGVHALGGEYNTGGLSYPGKLYSLSKDIRYQGWVAGAGVGYGYHWAVSRHWGMEAEIGAGYLYTRFTRYRCQTCGESLGKDSKHFFTPTKVALSIVYKFGDSSNKPLTPVQKEHVFIPAPVVADTAVTTQIPASQKQEPTYRTEERSRMLALYFRCGSAEMNKEDSTLTVIKNILDSISGDERLELKRITLTGFASPEEGAERNHFLSSARAQAVVSALTLSHPFVEEHTECIVAGADWDGFFRNLTDSGYLRTQEIICLMAKTELLQDRPHLLDQLMHLRDFKMRCRKIFPLLRRTEIRVEYSCRTIINRPE